MKRPWFRMHARVKDDAKLQLLPAGLFKTWVNLCCIACEREGGLPDIEAISYGLHKSAETTLDAICKLSKPPFQLVDRDDLGNLRMHDWDEWQYISDVSTERVRKHREAKSRGVKRSRNVSETVCNARGETDQRQKQNTDPLNPPPKTTAANGWQETAFEEFWERCVWAKIGKPDAQREYVKHATTPELASQINQAAKEQAPQLLAEGLARKAKGEAGPIHPRTWLYKGRWMDQPIPNLPLYTRELMT